MQLRVFRVVVQHELLKGSCKEQKPIPFACPQFPAEGLLPCFRAERAPKSSLAQIQGAFEGPLSYFAGFHQKQTQFQFWRSKCFLHCGPRFYWVPWVPPKGPPSLSWRCKTVLHFVRVPLFSWFHQNSPDGCIFSGSKRTPASIHVRVSLFTGCRQPKDPQVQFRAV